MNTVFQAVGAVSYPGRGIVAGMNERGEKVLVYFIMGRSENSRNRVFVVEGEGLRTQAADPAAVVDPSLIIYSAVRTFGDRTIVTNGDQTDTIYDFLATGGTFEDALRTREYEPDAPNYTPRISCLMKGNGAHKMSILKREGETCQRFFFEYAPVWSVGHYLHTYQGDGNPIPSFVGEPESVSLAGGAEEIGQGIWDALDADNKVALFVRVGGETRIFNKRKEAAAR